MTKTITEQLARELNIEPNRIVQVAIYPEHHQVDFKLETGSWYWAKLTQNNQQVRKHSVRYDSQKEGGSKVT